MRSAYQFGTVRNGVLNVEEDLRENGKMHKIVIPANPYSRTKSGKRPDLGGLFFRSAAEANYARYLNFAKIKWEYEPREFMFDAIRRGCVSYTPDFYLPEEDKWIEFKGWLSKKDITKIRRFKKFYPEEFKKYYIVFQQPSKKTRNVSIPALLDIGVPYTHISTFNKKHDEWARLIPGWE